MAMQDDDLINEFVVESYEHLADIENQLLAIEAGGAQIDDDLINKVFREIHSIKGAAGFLGLTKINRLSHVMENILNRMRNRTLAPTSAIVDTLLKAADALRHLVNDAHGSETADISAHLEALEAIQQKNPPTTVAPPAEPPPTAAASSVAPPTVAPPAEPPPAIAAPTIAAPTAAPIAASVPKTVPLVASASMPEQPAPSTTPSTTGATKTGAAQRTAEPQPTAAPSAADANIRVSVSVLDHLMNLAGELVLSRNQLLQAVEKDEKAGLHTASNGLDQVTSELQEAIMRTRMQPVGNVFGRFPRVVRDLCAKLGKQVELEMEGKDVEVDKTIVEAIGDPLTHLIRNSVDHGIEMPALRESRRKPAQGTIQLRAYHQAGKVRIDVEDDGNGIHPEKLRQKAVSMGIVTPERAQQMSDREAIRLIFHPGLSTAVNLTDVSGRGVGMDVVKTNIEKLGGNVDVESTVGQGTIIRITLPLTLAIIPSLIVRCAKERFAIPQINIVELVRLKPDEVSHRISKIKNAEVLRLRDHLLPLVRLNTALGWDRSEAGDCDSRALNIIVLESSQMRYGLVVDGLHDSEEIVVKALGRHLKDCRCLAGATILGDGHVALILDIDGIAVQTQLRMLDQDSDGKQTSQTALEARRDLLTILLFTNDPSEQFAVPMALVSRIERIRAAQIDRIGGQELLQYRGGTLPLLAVEGNVHAKPRPDKAQYYVIVFNMAGREIGLVAPHLEDIRDVLTNMDTVTLREPGVVGTLVIDNRTTRLLDMSELAHTAHPDWFPSTAAVKPPAPYVAPPMLAPAPPQPSPTASVATNGGDEPIAAIAAAPQVAAPAAVAPAPTHYKLLAAEDSPFFRRQVLSFLRGAGYEVVVFEDGQQAWDFLQRGNHGISLVVTDIEMPVMNGLQLCRNIKDHPELKRLPVITLTTLAGEEDIERGRQAGVDDYQIKMDRDNLLASIRRLLGGETDPNNPSFQELQEMLA